MRRFADIREEQRWISPCGPRMSPFATKCGHFSTSNLTDDLKAHAKLTPGILADHDLRVEWLKRLHKRGWSAPSWPKEYGGPGWNVMQRFIWSSECAAAGAPLGSNMGLSMVGPTLMGHGTPEQRAKYLPRILSGEDWWCQGYSEPGSGSDLASLQCRAVADGDDYVINGTKLWTTGAHIANKMFCLVRTDPKAKPQEGISFILIDEFHAPGIKIEPIITLAGDHEVNQVFFDDVRVPAPISSARKTMAGRWRNTCSNSSAAARRMARTCATRSTG